MEIKQMENDLYSKLLVLKNDFGCAGIKSEFENEASDFADLIFLRYITAKAGLKLFIKIGGVEAFTDLKMCIDLIADGVIVPMVESEFALIKSQNMIQDIFGKVPSDSGFEVIINIETRSAVANLDEILNAMESYITGITIGRSDLSYSYDIKGQQDSEFINHVIENILEKTLSYGGLRITVGGGISRKTFENEPFIQYIVPHLTHIETRNVILDAASIQNKKALEQALDFEKSYLHYKLGKKRMFTKFDESRFSTLNLRG
ncbi:MAG TPA: aldolase/citrate lyase family protein [Methanocella sp.]|nr:aldolase/citrate lyase family protein [Methanocella sp.]